MFFEPRFVTEVRLFLAKAEALSGDHAESLSKTSRILHAFRRRQRSRRAKRSKFAPKSGAPRIPGRTPAAQDGYYAMQAKPAMAA
jgi:hypothetical protein